MSAEVEHRRMSKGTALTPPAPPAPPQGRDWWASHTKLWNATGTLNAGMMRGSRKLSSLGLNLSFLPPNCSGADPAPFGLEQGSVCGLEGARFLGLGKLGNLKHMGPGEIGIHYGHMQRHLSLRGVGPWRRLHRLI